MTGSHPQKKLRKLTEKLLAYKIAEERDYLPGETSEEAIRRVLSPFAIFDLLNHFSFIANDENIAFNGRTKPQNGEITFTLQGLLAIISIVIADPNRTKPHAIASNLPQTNAIRLAITQAFLFFNNSYGRDSVITDMPAASTERVSTHLNPMMYAQDKYQTVPSILYSRGVAWFDRIPAESHDHRRPSELDEFVQKKYGISLDSLPAAFMALFAIGDTKQYLLTDRIANSMRPDGQKWLLSLLHTFAENPSNFESAWQGKTEPKSYLGLRIPIILRHPLWALALNDEHVACLPVPRAALNHLEEQFYWECFQHFLQIYRRPDNIFSNWFGSIFEYYCRKLLSAIASDEKFTEIFVPNPGEPAMDSFEIDGSEFTFFEFKARRPLRRDITIWDAKAEVDLKIIAQDSVDQFKKFCEKWPSAIPIPPRNANLRLIVVSPLPYLINQYIKDRNWFMEECQGIQAHLKLKKIPQIFFASVLDLEVIRREKARGVPLGVRWKNYGKSSYYPYINFSNWYAVNHGTHGGTINPYVTDNLNFGADRTEAFAQFVKVSKHSAPPKAETVAGNA